MYRCNKIFKLNLIRDREIILTAEINAFEKRPTAFTQWAPLFACLLLRYWLDCLTAEHKLFHPSLSPYLYGVGPAHAHSVVHVVRICVVSLNSWHENTFDQAALFRHVLQRQVFLSGFCHGVWWLILNSLFASTRRCERWRRMGERGWLINNHKVRQTVSHLVLPVRKQKQRICRDL